MLYWSVMGVFGIGMMLSQIDFVLMTLIADLLVSTFTMYKFTEHKTVDVDTYKKWNEIHINPCEKDVDSDEDGLARKDSLSVPVHDADADSS
jgi:hypothetical protein